jgi:4-hydroxybenzoate polyprenyltransferase
VIALSLFHAFFKPFVYSSLHMGFFGAAIAYAVSALLSTPFSLPTYLICFLIVFSLYNTNKSVDIEEDKINQPEKAEFQLKYGRPLYWAGILAYLIALSLAFLQGLHVFLATLFPLIIGLAYSIKFLPEKFRFRRFKDMPFLKNICIGFTLGFILVMIPAIAENIPLTWPVFLAFAFVFLRMIVNTVNFDVRDVKGDRESDVLTIPVLFGKRKTRLALDLVNTFSGLMVAWAVLAGFFPPAALVINLLTFTAYAYNHLEKGLLPELIHYELLIDGNESYLMAFLAFLGLSLL